MYVERFVFKGNLYGILGALPLFLMWLNLSWMIFLFGAELAHAAANLRRLREPEADEPQILTSDDAIAAVLYATREYERGTPARKSQLASHVNANGEAVDWLVRRLVEREILCKTVTREKDEPRYIPARPAAQITIAQVLDVCDERADSALAAIPALVQRVRERMQQSVRDLTIADLLAEAEAESGGQSVRVVRA